MAVKGRFHKLDDRKKRAITGKASGRLPSFQVEREARVSERVNIRNLVNEEKES